MTQAVAIPREHHAIIAELEAKGLVYTMPNGGKAIRYAGLLSLAHERGLIATATQVVQIPADGNGNLAIVHAEALFERAGTQLRFAGTGTCGPANANKMTKNYPIEMAETRALGRAFKNGVNAGDLTFADELPDEEEPRGQRQQLATQQPAQQQQAPRPTVVREEPAAAQPEPAIPLEELHARLIDGQNLLKTRTGYLLYCDPSMSLEAAQARYAQLSALYRALAQGKEGPPVQQVQVQRITKLQAALSMGATPPADLNETSAKLWIAELAGELNRQARQLRTAPAAATK